jgi:hypothetical protein
MSLLSYLLQWLNPCGGMCEWLKQAVLKTALPYRVTGVRIPLPPPCNYCLCSDFQVLFLNVPKMCPMGQRHLAQTVPKTRD